MNLREKHIQLVEAVNNASTEQEHRYAKMRLDNWREGVADSDRVLNYIAADLHYLDQGVDRPMCCGVFLDWKPSVPLDAGGAGK